MKIIKYIGQASAVGALTLAFASSAFASDVTMNTTGPDSVNKVTIDSSERVVTNNSNSVNVVNTNDQKASTGNVSADKNTSVGGVGSGDARNVNSSDTSVSADNRPASCNCAPGSNNPSLGAASVENGQPGRGSGSAGPSDVSAAGLGAGDAAMLPEVGAMFPVDVSALRAAWHPQSGSATEPAGLFTTGMLLTATVLSIAGALGSMKYAGLKAARKA